MARRRRRKQPLSQHPAIRAIEAVLVIGALGGMAYGLYYYAQKTDEFRVTIVHIKGIDLVTEDQIIEAAEVSLDDNLLFFGAGTAAERVEALAPVKTCTVSKVFPDTVLIEVEEREPVATLMIRNTLYEIDSEGVVVREAPSASSFSGPLITGLPDVDFVEPGDRVSDETLHEALAVWEAFAGSGVGQELHVSELSARGVNDIRMYCDELDYELRWGRGDYARQARRLDVLWEEKGGDLGCTTYLELRFGPQLACL